MKQLMVWFAVLVSMILFAAWLQKGGLKLTQTTSQAQNLKTMKVGERIINVEIADTEEEQAKGLSDRETLKEDNGMLFVMPKNSFPSFWMKGMQFNIDVIWINENKVVEISKDLPAPDPETSTDELPRYKPTQSTSYVLEVNTGFVDQNNIKVGQKVELPDGLEFHD